MGHEQLQGRRAAGGPALFERLARDAQGASTLSGFRLALLAVLQRELGADSAAMVAAPGAEASASGTTGLGSSADYAEHYLHHRPRFERSIAKLLGAVRRSGAAIDTDVYGLRERARLALYAEVLLPQGTSSVLAAACAFHGRPTGLIVLKRHGRGRPFSARESARMLGLLPAISLADAGFHYSHLPEALPPRLHASPGRLSPRETQVAALAGRGLTNGEIGLMLGSSPETVKRQLRSVFEKTGVRNRTALAAALGAGKL